MLIIDGDLGRILKVFWIVCGDVVFYSEYYSWMKKRIVFVVIIDFLDIGINFVVV